MNNWKAILAVCLIFAGGVFTGAFVATKVKSVTAHKTPQANLQNLPPQSKLEFMRKTLRQLDLTPEQTSKFDEIIDKGKERIRTRMQTVMPAVREELTKVRQNIAAELSAEQRGKFEEKIKQRFARPPQTGSATNSAASEAKPEPKP